MAPETEAQSSQSTPEGCAYTADPLKKSPAVIEGFWKDMFLSLFRFITPGTLQSYAINLGLHGQVLSL